MYGRETLALFPLDPSVRYLNHGAFGVTPHDVLAAQRQWQDRIEREPARFFDEALADRLLEARTAIAALLGTTADDLVFVDNATTGANAVFRALDLGAGDVVVDTSLGYPGVNNALRHRCSQTGAVRRTLKVPLPVQDDDALVDVVEDGLAGSARLLVVDQIASGSAVCFPVRELVGEARAVGARVFVDGAHAPGQLDVDLTSLGADWWVGNLHKWAFAPRGTAVLHAAPDVRDGLHPPTVSLGYDRGWPSTFHWPGTRDFSGWLAAPAGLAFADRLGGFAAIRAYGRQLQEEATALLEEAWGVHAVAPPSMRAQMAALPLPVDLGSQEEALAFARRLRHEHGIEVPVFFSGAAFVRIAAQVYNERADYEALARAVLEVGRT